MKFYTFLTLFGCLLTLNTYAQINVLVNVSEPVDESRYKDIKRHPYLFDEFVDGWLVDTKTRKPLLAKVNYNGYEKEFEFEAKGKKYLLDGNYYVKASLKNGPLNPAYQEKMMSGDSTFFLKAINPNDNTGFYISLLLSDEINIIKSFEVNIVENEVQDVGRTITRKYFAPKFFYFAVKQGQMEQFKLNKKGVLEVFSNKKNMEAFSKSKKVEDFIKSNKLKVNSDAELKQVISFYQSIR